MHMYTYIYICIYIFSSILNFSILVVMPDVYMNSIKEVKTPSLNPKTNENEKSFISTLMASVMPDIYMSSIGEIKSSSNSAKENEKNLKEKVKNGKRILKKNLKKVNKELSFGFYNPYSNACFEGYVRSLRVYSSPDRLLKELENKSSLQNPSPPINDTPRGSQRRRRLGTLKNINAVYAVVHDLPLNATILNEKLDKKSAWITGGPCKLGLHDNSRFGVYHPGDIYVYTCMYV
jgi:hypothetical protein